jgi:hypothetical protein
MSKFRRLRQHTATTRTAGAEKAASTVHGDNKITALDRWVHRDGTLIYVVPGLEPDTAETLERDGLVETDWSSQHNNKSLFSNNSRVLAGSEAGQALPPRRANGGGRVMRAHCADCDRAPASGAADAT